MDGNKLVVANKLKGLEDNVWRIFGKLATDYQAVDLGKGFPDSFPPDHVKEALIQAVRAPSPLGYQYTRNMGHPRLVKAIAKLYSPIFGRQIDPMNEILITVGAFGSLYCAITGLVNPGDEVIIIEPFFGCYERMVTLAGGTPVFVPLRPTKPNITSSADLRLDAEELASKFNSKTKAILFNSPNNPVGKVFSQEETEQVADLCRKHDVIVISDEVYEFLVYPPNQHVKIVNLPDMWERTLTIGSAGKIFNATGLRTGWTIGPKHLIKACQIMLENCVSSSPTLIQEALGTSFQTEIARFDQPDCYFKSQVLELMPKRDLIAESLRKAGMEPVVPEGGYFIIADYTKLGINYADDNSEPDFKFAKWLTTEKRLSGIPLSAFYSEEHRKLGENYIRFCFCKGDTTLEKVAEILKSCNGVHIDYTV